MLGLKPSKPIRSERDILLEKLRHFDRALTTGSTASAMERLRGLEEQFYIYRRREQEVFLPAVAGHLTRRERPFSRMVEEGRQEEQRLNEVRGALQAGRRGDSAYHGRLLVELLRTHIGWIDTTLLPLAERLLSAKDWETVRKESDAISSGPAPRASASLEFLILPEQRSPASP